MKFTSKARQYQSDRAEQNMPSHLNSLSLTVISSNGVLCEPSSSPLSDEGDSGLHCPSFIHNSMRTSDKTCLSLQRQPLPSPLSHPDLSWCWSALKAWCCDKCGTSEGPWDEFPLKARPGSWPIRRAEASEEFKFLIWGVLLMCLSTETYNEGSGSGVQCPAQGHFDKKRSCWWTYRLAAGEI